MYCPQTFIRQYVLNNNVQKIHKYALKNNMATQTVLYKKSDICKVPLNEVIKGFIDPTTDYKTPNDCLLGRAGTSSLKL